MSHASLFSYIISPTLSPQAPLAIFFPFSLITLPLCLVFSSKPSCFHQLRVGRILMKEIGRKHGAMSPCAACKLLRRRCAQDCLFAPYFPADEPHKFASVHKVFGASNVNKMLQELPEEQRSDAVSSMVYEANARVRDPVYGCVGAISCLQQQVDVLQTQLALAQAELVHIKNHQPSSSSPSPTQQPNHESDTTKSSLFAQSLWSC